MPKRASAKAKPSRVNIERRRIAGVAALGVTASGILGFYRLQITLTSS